jgi:DNA-binding MarR family transcriptional regulator
MLAVKQLLTPTRTDEIARLRATIGRISRTLRATRAGADLTPTQLTVLFTVVADGPLGIGELAEREGLNPTLLSRTIGHLVDAGLVRRDPDPTDRRAALVAATSVGRKLRDRARSERNDALARALGSLPDEIQERLLATLADLELLAATLREQA